MILRGLLIVAIPYKPKCTYQPNCIDICVQEHRYLCISAKETFISTKETFISTKETYVSLFKFASFFWCTTLCWYNHRLLITWFWQFLRNIQIEHCSWVWFLVILVILAFQRLVCRDICLFGENTGFLCGHTHGHTLSRHLGLSVSFLVWPKIM